MPEVVLSVLAYVAAGLIGAVLAFFLCVWAVDSIPNIREGFGGWAMVIYLGLSLLVGAPVGAALGVGLVFVYRRFGFLGVGAYLGALLLLCLTVWLYYGIRAAWEHAQEERYNVTFDQREHEIHRLLDAARRGDRAGVEASLSGGTFVDSYYTHDPIYGKTALMLAARAGDLDLVRLLLTHGALPDLVNDRGQTPRLLAELHGHTGAAVLLAEAERAGAG